MSLVLWSRERAGVGELLEPEHARHEARARVDAVDRALAHDGELDVARRAAPPRGGGACGGGAPSEPRARFSPISMARIVASAAAAAGLSGTGSGRRGGGAGGA